MAGLAFGHQLSRYADGPGTDQAGSEQPKDAGPVVGGRLPVTGSSRGVQAVGAEVGRGEAVFRFHLLLGELADRVGGARTLAEVSGRSGWPDTGVYFFSEPGELREGGGTRVVRVGSHALTATSKTTLWSRLRAHRGTAKGGGNHRASVFRLHVGTALLARGQHPEAAMTWGRRSSAPAGARDVERGLERAVSDHIGQMPFLWLAVGDRKDRALVERGSIALLSNHGRPAIDPASPGWLGRDADRDLVRSSHLWNVTHTQDDWSPDFLRRLEALVGAV